MGQGLGQHSGEPKPQVLPIRLAGWMRAPSVRVTKSTRPNLMQVQRFGAPAQNQRDSQDRTVTSARKASIRHQTFTEVARIGSADRNRKRAYEHTQTLTLAQ